MAELRCVECNALLHSKAPVEHRKHVWRPYWSTTDFFCRACFKDMAARREADGDWPANPRPMSAVERAAADALDVEVMAAWRADVGTTAPPAEPPFPALRGQAWARCEVVSAKAVAAHRELASHAIQRGLDAPAPPVPCGHWRLVGEMQFDVPCVMTPRCPGVMRPKPPEVEMQVKSVSRRRR